MTLNANPLLLGDDGGYSLTRSLRFRSSASAYLNRTPASAGSLTTFTYSGWVKRGTLSSSGSFPLLWAGNGGTQDSNLYFYNDVLQFETYNSGTDYILRTTQVFRDPAAWYHIVAVWDTTNATSTERMRLYLNGQRITAFSNAAYPTLNYQSFINAAQTQNIGKYTSSYFDGYMAEVNFIDGQALTPSSFGAFSPYNQWLPKKYSGTYGTNGFYLPFTNNASAATLGNDFSGNSNTWTTNNISVTAGSTYDSTTDVPTLTSATAANYAVMNPLSATSPTIISNGNLTVATGVSGGGGAWSTIALTSGKYYFEFTATGISGASCRMGVNDSTRTNGVEYYDNGDKVVNGSQTSYGASYTDGDLIGVACDLVANTITFYKNNTSQGAISYSTWSTINMFAFCADGSGSSGITANFNFGQRPFTYTPPSGYVALNTFNL